MGLPLCEPRAHLNSEAPFLSQPRSAGLRTPEFMSQLSRSRLNLVRVWGEPFPLAPWGESHGVGLREPCTSLSCMGHTRPCAAPVTRPQSETPSSAAASDAAPVPLPRFSGSFL